MRNSFLQFDFVDTPSFLQGTCHFFLSVSLPPVSSRYCQNLVLMERNIICNLISPLSSGNDANFPSYRYYVDACVTGLARAAMHKSASFLKLGESPVYFHSKHITICHFYQSCDSSSLR